MIEFLFSEMHVDILDESFLKFNEIVIFSMCVLKNNYYKKYFYTICRKVKINEFLNNFIQILFVLVDRLKLNHPEYDSNHYYSKYLETEMRG